MMKKSEIKKVLVELRGLFLVWRRKCPLAVYSSVAILFLSFIILRITLVVSMILLLVGGFMSGLFLFNPGTLCPNFLWIYARPSKKSSFREEEKLASRPCHVCGKDECGRHRSDFNIKSLQPWIDIEIPEKINDALEEFFNIVFKEYIYNWYNDLSADESFVNELKIALRFSISVVLRRLKKVDIPIFISTKIIPLSLKHLHYCLKVMKSDKDNIPVSSSSFNSSNLKTSSSSNDLRSSSSSQKQHQKTSSLPTPPPPSGVTKSNQNGNIISIQLEQLILESYGHHLHCAARTRRYELDYLKQVADKIFSYVLPSASLKSRSFYALVRELFTGAILLPVMDIVGDPDIINNVLLLYLDKSPLEDPHEAPSKLVPILQGFSQRLPSTLQDQKNLQLKLSSIIPEPDTLFPFMQFMKAEASINVLQFYLFIEEFNRKILTPELTPEKLESLHKELQKLYENYFDPGAHDCIRFDADITAQIKNICEGPAEGVIKLQTTTPLFRAYEQAYDLLEHYFLPIFHQSDIYYKMLCGERAPMKSDRSNSKSIKRGSTSDSLSRLGSKIKCVFKTNAVDGRLISDADDYEIEEVDDPLMSEEFFLQTPNNTNRLVESPVSLAGEDATTFLLPGGGTMDNPLRNLSLWVVSVPSIGTKFDPSDPGNSKKFSFVFRVEVKRLAEDKENTFEPEEWSIERRYHEFYVLETKLREFHGEFEDAVLPPKKTFVPKNKTFFENLRPNFESFLRILLTKPTLRGSQLVHSFLTSEQEFTTSFLDVNLGKKVKSGAMKLVKERGQHLEPFLKSFLQSTEAPKSKPVKTTDGDSDTLSISSEKMINSIYNNNANIEDLPFPVTDSRFNSKSTEEEKKGEEEEEGSYFDAVLYLSHALFEAPDWLMHVLLSLRVLLRNTVDTFLDWFIAKKINQVLTEHYVVKIIHLLKDVLFFDNDPPRTDEEKKERQIKALKELTDYIPKIYIRAVGSGNYDQGMQLIFNLLQQPRLNKQLSYMLLDSILLELFPELQTEDQDPNSGTFMTSADMKSSDGFLQQQNQAMKKRQIKSI